MPSSDNAQTRRVFYTALHDRGYLRIRARVASNFEARGKAVNRPRSQGIILHTKAYELVMHFISILAHVAVVATFGGLGVAYIYFSILAQLICEYSGEEDSSLFQCMSLTVLRPKHLAEG